MLLPARAGETARGFYRGAAQRIDKGRRAAKARLVIGSGQAGFSHSFKTWRAVEFLLQSRPAVEVVVL